MKRSLSVRSLLAVTLVLAACSKKDAGEGELPEVAPESVPVLAVVELPSARSLGDAAQVIDTVQPGTSAMVAASMSTMLTSMAEIGSLNGADLDKPVRVVVLDPKQHPMPALLLVGVSNAEQLAQAVGKERMMVVRKDLALIGAPEAVKVAHDYAFGTLARREAPAGPRATVYVQPILASYKAEIEAGKAQLGPMMAMMGGGSETMSKVLTLYADGLLAVAEQTERVEARFASQDTLGGVELVLHARPETTFAGFNAAQAPSELALVATLPAHESPVMVMAGDMALGPARQAFQQTGEALIAAMWGADMTAEMRGLLEPFLDLFTGRFAAMVTSMGMTPSMVQLLETKDSAQAASATRKLMEAFTASGKPIEMMGVKQTISFTPEAFAHDGVNVMMQQTRTEITTPAADPAAQQPTTLDSTSYFAGVDGFFTMAMGEEASARQLIDVVRGKAPRLQAGGALAKAMAATAARKDSVMMFMDLSAIPGAAGSGAPGALLVTLGFEQAQARMFVAAAR